jgi:hypothetical protein
MMLPPRRFVAASTTNLVHDATYKPRDDSRIGRAKKSGFTDSYDQASTWTVGLIARPHLHVACRARGVAQCEGVAVGRLSNHRPSLEPIPNEVHVPG